MKKLVALLVALCMILSCIGAVAEEVSQAVLAEAFKGKVQQLMGSLAPGRSLTYTVDAVDGTSFKEVASMLLDAAGKPLADLTVNVPGEEAPVQLQFSEEAAWLKYQGQVMELRFADLEAIGKAALGSLSMPQMDPQVASELAQILLMNTILPGVKVESNENSTTIQVALTAKDVLAGVARFGDQVLANEKYWNELKPLIQFVAKQQNYQGDFAADLQENWPQLKEQILAVETDAQLNANVIIQSVPESGATAVAGKIVFSMQGQDLSLVLGAADSPKNLEITATVSMAAYGRENELGTLNLTCDKIAGNLKADLSVPAAQLEIKLTGTVAQQGNTFALQAHIDAFQARKQAFTMDVESIYADGTVTSNSIITVGNSTASSTFYWSKYLKTLNVSSAGGMFTLEFRNDDKGNFSAALSLPQNQGDIALEGCLTETSLHAVLTYTNPLMAMMRRANTGVTAELNAAWGRDSLTANVTVTAGRETYAGQLFWTKAAKILSIQSKDFSLSLNVQQDAEGNIALARLIVGPENGFEATFTPDAATYSDAAQDVLITWKFVSETEHVVDIAVTPVGGETQHAYVRTTITEEADTIRLDCVLEAEGQTAMKASMVCAPTEGEIALLADQNPTQITAEMVTALLQQLIASAAQTQQALPAQK